MKKIDLGKYKAPESIILSGRDKGEMIRTKLDLAREDRDPDPVVITVPPELVSLNSSFFLGLFDKSVAGLGAEKFETKYRFECSPLIQRDIERGKQAALTTSNPLKKG